MKYSKFVELTIQHENFGRINATLFYAGNDGLWYPWRWSEVGVIAGCEINIHYEQCEHQLYTYEKVLHQFEKAKRIAREFVHFDFMLQFTSPGANISATGPNSGIQLRFEMDKIMHHLLMPYASSVVETFMRARDEIEFRLKQYKDNKISRTTT